MSSQWNKAKTALLVVLTLVVLVMLTTRGIVEPIVMSQRSFEAVSNTEQNIDTRSLSSKVSKIVKSDYIDMCNGYCLGPELHW